MRAATQARAAFLAGRPSGSVRLAPCATLLISSLPRRRSRGGGVRQRDDSGRRTAPDNQAAATPAEASCEKATSTSRARASSRSAPTSRPTRRTSRTTTRPTARASRARSPTRSPTQLGFAKDEVKWTVVPFNSSYAPGPKKFDFDINQISITPKRARSASTSPTPYYTAPQAVVALKGSDGRRAPRAWPSWPTPSSACRSARPASTRSTTSIKPTQAAAGVQRLQRRRARAQGRPGRRDRRRPARPPSTSPRREIPAADDRRPVRGARRRRLGRAAGEGLRADAVRRHRRSAEAEVLRRARADHQTVDGRPTAAPDAEAEHRRPPRASERRLAREAARRRAPAATRDRRGLDGRGARRRWSRCDRHQPGWPTCARRSSRWETSRDVVPRRAARLLARREAVHGRRGRRAGPRAGGRAARARRARRRCSRCGCSAPSTPTSSAACRRSWSSTWSASASRRSAAGCRPTRWCSAASRWRSPTAPTSPRSTAPGSSRCTPASAPRRSRSGSPRRRRCATSSLPAGGAARRAAAAQRLHLAAEGRRAGLGPRPAGGVPRRRRSTASSNFNYTPLVAAGAALPVRDDPAGPDRRPHAARGSAGDDAPCSRSAASPRRTATRGAARASTWRSDEHEAVALIGASGSGKSTLLRCIDLLEEIDDGDVLLDGEVITDPSRRPGGGAPPARDGLPGLQPVPAPDRARERRARRRCARTATARAEAEARGARAARALRPGRARGRPPGPALGRPAAARGDRARAGHAPARAAARRGHQRARPRAGRRGARA